VPVVIGDIVQIRELLADGVNARLCALDAQSIATGLLDLLGNRERAAEIARRGRETALQAGDIHANGRRFAADLRAVTENGSRPGTLALLPFRAMLLIYLATKRWFPNVCG
jgi:hypothetical protein